jgi:flavin reductase (DIM6/NTAB) family NADH-FMN oxidoreductase RutF
MEKLVVTQAERAPLDMLFKPFSTIGHDWMLITAGSGIAREQWNTMTASWGSFGVFWNKRTVTCVIRPTRHTFAFVEREPLVTFSFFDPTMKQALQICGSTSGVDTDKASAAGLTAVVLEPGAIGFAEAKINLVCRKLYAQDLDPESFLDPELEKNYPEKDYHRMYVCEILRVYQPEKTNGENS